MQLQYAQTEIGGKINDMTLTGQISGFMAWFLLCFLAAALGAYASVNAGSFYTALVRPDWAPPPWLFGPVWTILYILMAIAVWLVWRIDGFMGARLACSLFIVQLGFNALWSFLFFTWHQGAWALIDILVLWLSLLATIIAFWQLSVLAACLMMPYLAWVSIAVLLNYRIWQLNPGAL